MASDRLGAHPGRDLRRPGGVRGLYLPAPVAGEGGGRLGRAGAQPLADDVVVPALAQLASGTAAAGQLGTPGPAMSAAPPVRKPGAGWPATAASPWSSSASPP